ncbi:MAG: AEC family transporter [Eubacterium sp.]|jgi:predicted permease|nr:AEC family transporter [Eubacterium sp.]MCH4047688.1 AEC family transporter [Eubacterium sp.]MCH4078460.1 AEC family transporter [Eubacterium sp.]MCH4109604.1 AEC family transporter [Eubacterium sp.]MCI1306700.1 AEC family transporter [Eubacterium sp.]
MQTGSLITQIIIMFLLMGTGLLIHKLKMMSAETSKQLVNILFMVISPCVIIHSFQKPFSASRLHGLLLAFLMSMLFFLLSSIIAHLAYLKVKDPVVRTISEFGTVYPNMGFLGIPLAQAVLGNTGVFYAAPMLAASNIFTWSIGVNLYRNHHRTGKRKASAVILKILLNPNIIAIIVGIIIFMFSVNLPGPLTQAISYVSDANTPLAMFVVGDSLAQFHWNKEAFNIPVFSALLLRNFLLPLGGALFYPVFGLQGTAFWATVLLSACPSASMCVLFAVQEDMDPTCGISLMTISTVLCIFTIPLVFAIAGAF